MGDTFDEKVETFCEYYHTEAMTSPPASVKNRLDLLRKVFSTFPMPPNNKSQLWVKPKSKGYWRTLEKSITVGASPDSELHLDDECVSGKHCQINHHENGWEILDLDSTNGVYVNGLRVSDKKLNDGDVINLGDCCLIFVDEGI